MCHETSKTIFPDFQLPVQTCTNLLNITIYCLLKICNIFSYEISSCPNLFTYGLNRRCLHAHTFIHIHTCKHTYVYTHINIHTHKCVHTHTYMGWAPSGRKNLAKLETRDMTYEERYPLPFYIHRHMDFLVMNNIVINNKKTLHNIHCFLNFFIVIQLQFYAFSPSLHPTPAKPTSLPPLHSPL